MEPNQQNNDLKNLLLKLKQKGANREEIVEVVNQINQLASTKFYAELMANLDKQDVIEVNEIKSQQKANQVIMQKFEQKTGKNAEVVKDEIISAIASEYLQNLDKQK